MAQEQKMYGEDDEDNGTGLNYKIPDTRTTASALEQAIQQEHMDMMEEEDKEDKKNGKKPKKREKKKGVICFCMSPTCRIGGFIEKPEDA